MLASRLSRVAASSNRCIIDSKGLSSLISLASSTKALGIDFLPGTDMNAWGEHYLNGAKHLRSRLSEFTCAYHWEPRLYPTFGTSSNDRKSRLASNSWVDLKSQIRVPVRRFLVYNLANFGGGFERNEARNTSSRDYYPDRLFDDGACSKQHASR